MRIEIPIEITLFIKVVELSTIFCHGCFKLIFLVPLIMSLKEINQTSIFSLDFFLIVSINLSKFPTS